MKDRFDLEQELMKCWMVTDDLDYLLTELMEGFDNCKTGVEIRDKASNVVLGMRELYDIKFETLFRTFEECIRQGHLDNFKGKD
jgi:hypothetical protein